jgi:hypothetical protein
MTIKKQFGNIFYEDGMPKRGHSVIAGLNDDGCIFVTITDTNSGKPEHHEIVFNSEWIPDNIMDWFGSVLTSQVYKLFLSAQNSKREFIADRYRDFKNSLSHNFPTK